MVADSLDHGGGAAVPHGETLPREAVEEDLSRRGAVEKTVPRDPVLIGLERRSLRHLHDDPASGETLAKVIVGLALQHHGHTVGQEGAETLARGTPEMQFQRAVRETPAPVQTGDAVAENGADGTVHIADAHLDPRGFRRENGLLQAIQDGPVGMIGETRVRACAHAVEILAHGFGQQRGEIQPLGFPMGNSLALPQVIHAADHFLELPEPQTCHPFAHILGHESHVTLHEFRLACELAP